MGKDQKKLLKLTGNLVGSNLNINPPKLTSADLLAYNFSNLFLTKTTNIRIKIIYESSNNTCNISIDADIMFNGKMIKIFRPTSEVEVKEIITKSSNKSFDLQEKHTRKCENLRINI